MTLSELIQSMAPRQGRQIGWPWLKKALLLLDTDITTVEDKVVPISVELTEANGYTYEIVFDTEIEDYIISNKWGDTANGNGIRVNITNRDENGFTISCYKACTFECLVYKS